ncbi:MAG: maltose/maltodextrin ABC transporter substrate-binding protein MalE [Succinivibrionaceae bacterium]
MSTFRFYVTSATFAISLSCISNVSCADSSKIVIWTPENKPYQSILDIGKQFYKDTGIAIEVERYDDIHFRFQKMSLEKKGPDIFLWANDRWGEWITNGLIEPISPSKKFMNEFITKGWQAFLYNNKYYGYPLILESLSLLCNSDLVEEAPKTYESIVVLDKKMKEQGKRGLLWSYEEPYHSYPLFSAVGAYSFKATDSGFDKNDVGVNVEGAEKALNFIVDIVKNRILPRGTDMGIIDTSFARGEVACVINGPWSWNKYDKKGVNFTINPLPTFDGKNARPFVGVQGFGISSSSPNKEKATLFLEKYLLTENGIRKMNNDFALGAITHKKLIKEFENNPVQGKRISVTILNAQNGDIMPNIPEMTRFWTFFSSAIRDSTKGRTTPKKALETAERRIKQ